MSVLYVPIVPPPPPSHQARELAEQLEKVIADYQAAHPSVSARDVRAALMLAQRRSAAALGPRVAIVAIGVVVAIGAAALIIARNGGVQSGGSTPGVIVAVLVTLVAIAVGLARRRG